ncbi:MAG: methyltransferase domain-containing protein [Patescibacteria group bacterium]|jgi:ubiquinone/menaquinone biosynthesis C-methylase UbiE
MAHSGGALINPEVIFEKIHLAPGMRVADLGCGRTGHFVFSASKVVGDQGVVYAVEIIKDILESIKSRCRAEGYGNVQAIWSDVESIGKTPIPEKCLDACFMVNILFLVKDKTLVLKEAARLLQKDGYAVVVDWSKKLGPLGPTPDQMVSETDLHEAAGKAGLAFQENVVVGDYHFCAIFKKMY